MSSRYALAAGRLLIAWRWPLLLMGAVLAGVCWFPSQQLAFDRSIENMFAPDDPLLAPYGKLKRTFGGNEIALAAYVDEELMTAEGIQRVQQLTTQLEETPGVSAVVSLTQTPLGRGIVNSSLPMSAAYLELFEGYTIGRDRRTVAVACILDPAADTLARSRTIDQLKELVRRHDSSGVLTGEPVMVVEGFRLIEEDGNRLGRISTVLLLATIIACFRSLRWTLIPLAVVNLTLLTTQGLLVASQLQLSMVSSMLWAIVTVIGVAMVIHIIVHFRDARAEKLSPRDALLVSVAALAAPIFWTCCTDAAGFASLLAASVGPVRDFGIMMTVGALLSLVSVTLLLPGMALAGKFDTDPHWAWGEGYLNSGLRRALELVLRRPRTISLTWLAVVALAAWGCFRLEVETDFTKNFRASSDLVKSYELVESNLGGAGVWDVLIPAPQRLDTKYLDRVRRLQRRLREEVSVVNSQGVSQPGLTKVLSVTDALDTAPVPDFPLARLLNQEGVLRVKLTAFEKLMPHVAASLHAEDSQQPGQYYLRVMLRARERQPARQKQQLIDQVTRISREEFEGAEVTGFFVLLASLIESMIRDQWLTFGLACSGIWLMMLIAFRSPLLAVVALVPNILPILLVTGLLGWLGVKINMGAAMIAAVSVGLSVDSSIHYITAYRRERSAGRSPRQALQAVQQNVGRAVSFSTLALLVGFSALCLSDFVPTIYFGALVSLCLLGGMAGNLVILPGLLQFLHGEQTPVSESQETSPLERANA